MSLLPLSRPIDRVWLRAGFEKRESIKSSEEGRERICVEFVILITPSPMGRGVDIRAGFVCRAADYYKSVLGYNKTQLGGRKLLVSPI
jgi:hypothetical protein